MKWFKRVLFAVLGTSIVLGGLGLYLNYLENNTFRAVESIDGIYLGQSREELLFSENTDVTCADFFELDQDCDSFTLRERAGGEILDVGEVDLESDRVVRILKSESLSWLSISNTEDLIRQLGEPDIYSIFPDFRVRSYVYADENWSFRFEKNQLRSVEWGKIKIGSAFNFTRYLEETFRMTNDWRPYYVYSGAKIFLRGEQICPGTKCPFQDGDRIEDKILDAKELEELLLGKVE